MPKTKENKGSILDYILAVFLVLSFVFSQYVSFIPGLTLGELMLIAASVLILYINKFRFKLIETRILLLYFFIAMVSSVIAILISDTSYSMTGEGEIASRWIRYFTYVLFIVFYCDNYVRTEKNGSILINLYKIAVYIFALYGILQFFVYILFKVYLPINILPMKMTREVSTEMLLENANNSALQVQSFFAEPGYFAKFLLPGIVFSLLGWEPKVISGRIDWKSLVIISAAIIFSGSLQGIILMIAIYIVSFIISQRFSKRRLIYVLITFFVLLAGVLFVINSGLLDRPLQRIDSIVSGDNIDRSAQLRVYRGFAYWKQLPFEHKFFGVGMGNAANYADQYHIVTEFDYYTRTEATLDYMSGISSILVTHGIVCAFLFVFMILKYRKSMNHKGFIILLIYVALLFGGGNLFSILGVMYFSFAFSCTNRQLEDENGLYVRAVKSGTGD